MIRMLWPAAAVWALDQATKLAALEGLSGRGAVELAPFFNLALAFNSGAAFSFLSGAGGWQNGFFAAVAALVSVAIVVMLRRLPVAERQTALALQLILGGAIGNLTDRLLRGFVIDFIDLYYGAWHWPTFNIADSAISIGAVLLVLDTLGLRLLRAGAR
jgi:signal peptidase II